MTTNIKIDVDISDNLTQDNKIFNFRNEYIDLVKSKSGITLYIDNTDKLTATDNILRKLYLIILKYIDNMSLWTLLGTGEIDPRSKIALYKKLWGTFKYIDIKFDESAPKYEVKYDLNNKVIFFGATQVTENNIPAALKIYSERYSSYLALLPKTVNLIKPILSKGWGIKTSGGFDFNLLSEILNNKGVLFKFYAGFGYDEPGYSTGFTGIGQPEIIHKLHDRFQKNISK